MADERSVSDVLQDILRNVQDMVRSESASRKWRYERRQGGPYRPAVWIGAGTVGAVSAWITAVDTGLRPGDPDADVADLVCGVMAAAAAVLILGGIRRAKRILPIPERTVESVKENLE